MMSPTIGELMHSPDKFPPQIVMSSVDALHESAGPGGVHDVSVACADVAFELISNRRIRLSHYRQRIPNMTMLGKRASGNGRTAGARRFGVVTCAPMEANARQTEPSMPIRAVR